LVSTEIYKYMLTNRVHDRCIVTKNLQFSNMYVA
jgi:hypothetical protein